MNGRRFVLRCAAAAFVVASGSSAFAEVTRIVCRGGANGPNFELEVDFTRKTAQTAPSGTLHQYGGPATVQIAGSTATWKVPVARDPQHNWMLYSLNRATGVLTIQFCDSSGCQLPSETDNCEKAANKF